MVQTVKANKVTLRTMEKQTEVVYDAATKLMSSLYEKKSKIKSWSSGIYSNNKSKKKDQSEMQTNYRIRDE